jgi:hypothetical protein
MTVFFRGKRLSKKWFGLLLCCTLLATVIIYRQPIAIKSIEHLTQPQNISVTCLSFVLDWQLNIDIEQMCLASPRGNLFIQNAIWQPWSNVLSIEQITITHIEQLATDNKVIEAPLNGQQTIALNLPDSLPKLYISSLKIDSFVLLQPLQLSVNSVSDNKLNFTGDLNASLEVYPNTVVGNIEWNLSDLEKWLPQAQKFYQDSAEQLQDAVLDTAQIKTNVTFDGVTFHAENSVDIASVIHVSNCPIDAILQGNVLVDISLSSLNISLDLSQLNNDISIVNCPLITDYFAKDDVPQLSFLFPQKMTISQTQVEVGELHIIDKQNTHRSIILKALNYKTTGLLEVDYTTSIKQALKTKQIHGGILDLQGAGNLSVDLSTVHTQDKKLPIDFKITNGSNQLVINDLQMHSLLIGKLTMEFSLHENASNQLELKGDINSQDIQVGAVKLAKTSSLFSITGENFNDLQLSIDNQLFQISHPEFRLHNLANHLDLNIQKFDTLSFSGNSTITKLTTQNINLLPIDLVHKGQASLANMTVSSQHDIGFKQGFSIQLEQQKTQVKAHINQQDITSLQHIISQLENALLIKEGKLSASIAFALPKEGEPFFAQGKSDFQGVTIKYQDYVLNNITYQTPLTFDSAGLQLAESTLHIDSIEAGVSIETLQALVIAKDSVFRLSQIHGEIFNGKFSSSQLWLDGREQEFDINFQGIDLSQVVALQQQPGIKITGNIDGDLPMLMNTHGISIDKGWASSLSGGKLTIIDNPSFDSIKVQQPELALLENIDFSQLESKIKLNPDGWVFFDFALQGNNPDKKQSVNLNYSHQENVLALLESIRLVKSVENRIEQKITQGKKK